MILGLVQYSPEWENKEVNKNKLHSLHRRDIGDRQTDLLIFPEMTLSGFSLDPGKTTLNTSDIQYFKDLAQEFNSAVTFGGVLDNKNMSLTINRKGEVLSRYEKHHLFSFAKENSVYESGNNGADFVLEDFHIRPLVCYDIRFPYLSWQHEGTITLFVVIANWPVPRITHWRTLLTARAIENQAYFAGVNRVGRDPNVVYPGSSLLIDPKGEILLDCGEKECISLIEINTAEVKRLRRMYPFLKDRKNEAFT
jgi:omega-amidase